MARTTPEFDLYPIPRCYSAGYEHAVAEILDAAGTGTGCDLRLSPCGRWVRATVVTALSAPTTVAVSSSPPPLPAAKKLLFQYMRPQPDGLFRREMEWIPDWREAPDLFAKAGEFSDAPDPAKDPNRSPAAIRLQSRVSVYAAIDQSSPLRWCPGIVVQCMFPAPAPTSDEYHSDDETAGNSAVPIQVEVVYTGGGNLNGTFKSWFAVASDEIVRDDSDGGWSIGAGHGGGGGDSVVAATTAITASPTSSATSIVAAGESKSSISAFPVLAPISLPIWGAARVANSTGGTIEPAESYDCFVVCSYCHLLFTIGAANAEAKNCVTGYPHAPSSADRYILRRRSRARTMSASVGSAVLFSSFTRCFPCGGTPVRVNAGVATTSGVISCEPLALPSTHQHDSDAKSKLQAKLIIAKTNERKRAATALAAVVTIAVAARAVGTGTDGDGGGSAGGGDGGGDIRIGIGVPDSKINSLLPAKVEQSWYWIPHCPNVVLAAESESCVFAVCRHCEALYKRTRNLTGLCSRSTNKSGRHEPEGTLRSRFFLAPATQHDRDAAAFAFGAASASHPAAGAGAVVPAVAVGVPLPRHLRTATPRAAFETRAFDFSLLIRNALIGSCIGLPRELAKLILVYCTTTLAVGEKWYVLERPNPPLNEWDDAHYQWHEYDVSKLEVVPREPLPATSGGTGASGGGPHAAFEYRVSVRRLRRFSISDGHDGTVHVWNPDRTGGVAAPALSLDFQSEFGVSILPIDSTELELLTARLLAERTVGHPAMAYRQTGESRVSARIAVLTADADKNRKRVLRIRHGAYAEAVRNARVRASSRVWIVAAAFMYWTLWAWNGALWHSNYVLQCNLDAVRTTNTTGAPPNVTVTTTQTPVCRLTTYDPVYSPIAGMRQNASAGDGRWSVLNHAGCTLDNTEEPNGCVFTDRPAVTGAIVSFAFTVIPISFVAWTVFTCVDIRPGMPLNPHTSTGTSKRIWALVISCYLVCVLPWLVYPVWSLIDPDGGWVVITIPAVLHIALLGSIAISLFCLIGIAAYQTRPIPLPAAGHASPDEDECRVVHAHTEIVIEDRMFVFNAIGGVLTAIWLVAVFAWCGALFRSYGDTNCLQTAVGAESGGEGAGSCTLSYSGGGDGSGVVNGAGCFWDDRHEPGGVCVFPDYGPFVGSTLLFVIVALYTVSWTCTILGIFEFGFTVGHDGWGFACRRLGRACRGGWYAVWYAVRPLALLYGVLAGWSWFGAAELFGADRDSGWRALRIPIFLHVVLAASSFFVLFHGTAIWFAVLWWPIRTVNRSHGYHGRDNHRVASIRPVFSEHI